MRTRHSSGLSLNYGFPSKRQISISDKDNTEALHLERASDKYRQRIKKMATAVMAVMMKTKAMTTTMIMMKATMTISPALAIMMALDSSINHMALPRRTLIFRPD
jgi:hypothetical protein